MLLRSVLYKIGLKNLNLISFFFVGMFTATPSLADLVYPSKHHPLPPKSSTHCAQAMSPRESHNIIVSREFHKELAPEKELISRFYSWNGEPGRYYSKVFAMAMVPPGRYLSDDHQWVTNYGTAPLLGFHRIGKATYGVDYAATLGVAIVRVERLSTPSDKKAQDKFEQYFRQRKTFYEFLSSHSIPSSKILAKFSSNDGRTYIISDLIVGFSYSDLWDLHSSQMVSEVEDWGQAFGKLKISYEESRSRITTLIKSEGYQEFAKEHNLPAHYELGIEDLVYTAEGEWVLSSLTF